MVVCQNKTIKKKDKKPKNIITMLVVFLIFNNILAFAFVSV